MPGQAGPVAAPLRGGPCRTPPREERVTKSDKNHDFWEKSKKILTRKFMWPPKWDSECELLSTCIQDDWEES